MWWVSLATLLAGGSRVGSGETDLCCLVRRMVRSSLSGYHLRMSVSVAGVSITSGVGRP